MERGVVAVHLVTGEVIRRETQPAARVADDLFLRLVTDAQHIVLTGVTRTMEDASVQIYGPQRIAHVTVAREVVDDH